MNYENLEELQEEIREKLRQKNINYVKNILEEMQPQDIALLFKEISDEEIIVLFRILSKDLAVETFAEMDSDLQEKLIKALTDKELKEVIQELFTDDTVDLIEEMPSNVVKRILRTIPAEERNLINQFLRYPENSAGSIMTDEFVDLKENMTVADAFDKIRKVGIDKETIYTCYCLSEDRKLLGTLTVKELLLSKMTDHIKDLMNMNVIYGTTLEDQEDVANKLKKYDLLALPIVDNENRLVGIITIDDAIDVLEEENTEDFQKMAAITLNGEEYFKTSTFKHAKSRILWLLFLMISATITGKIITKYETAFEAVPLLVAFIPMIMGTGGNCGSQASTLIIRGLATNEIKPKDILKAIWKETRVAVLVGVVLSIVNGVIVMWQYQDLSLAIVVGITLIFTVLLAKILGCILPIFAKKIHLDPAIMASPLITTIVDICSVLIYFVVATAILKI